MFPFLISAYPFAAASLEYSVSTLWAWQQISTFSSKLILRENKSFETIDEEVRWGQAQLQSSGA